MTGLSAQQTEIDRLGHFILADSEYSSTEWDSLSILVTISESRENLTGYSYLGTKFEARTPADTFTFFDHCQALQAAMTPPGAEPWKQALIHITKPGPQINIKFEYDDPTRWSLKKVSLDMADYAESLRPPRD